MKKPVKMAALVLCLFLLFSGCESAEDMRSYATQRCKKMAAACKDVYRNAEIIPAADEWANPTISQDTVDVLEDILLEAGFDVLDSSAGCPSYLPTADHVYKFWEKVRQGNAGRQELIAVSQYGILNYWLFVYDAQEDIVYLHTMAYSLGQDREPSYEVRHVLDWEVTKKGNFYYQTRVADHSHYEDYTLVRLTAPDAELYDWNARCILPIGYIATNLFLTDWSESDWNGLSFNDLWEYFYLSEHGEPYQPTPQSKLCNIPAEDFESLIKPYFDIDTDILRELAQYQPENGTYPWRPVKPNDFHFLGFYACTPEVTGYRDNGDGTVTLTVEVLSTDLKTDCLFAHEVTIRPLRDGKFQYVSNKITYQTEHGLPYDAPRLIWD